MEGPSRDDHRPGRRHRYHHARRRRRDRIPTRTSHDRATPVLPAFTLTRNGGITAAIAALAAVLYTWSLSSVGLRELVLHGRGEERDGRAGRRSSSARSIRATSSPSTSRPPRCGCRRCPVAIFGFSSFSMLLPEALAGVASVLILHRLVRKWAGDTAAHLAALAFALTPVAVLMFRYNNPDAFLTFLCLAAAWALWSAVETGRTRMARRSRPRWSGSRSTRRCCRPSWSLPAFIVVYLVAGKPRLCEAHRPARGRAGHAHRLDADGGSRWSRCGRRRRGRTSAARATTPSSVCCSVTTACRASSADRGPAGGAGPGGGASGAMVAPDSAARPACSGCSTSRTAARSRGCSRWRPSGSSAGCG